MLERKNAYHNAQKTSTTPETISRKLLKCNKKMNKLQKKESEIKESRKLHEKNERIQERHVDCEQKTWYDLVWDLRRFNSN